MAQDQQDPGTIDLLGPATFKPPTQCFQGFQPSPYYP